MRRVSRAIPRPISILALLLCCRMVAAQTDYHTQGGNILKNDCVWEGRGTNKIGGLSDGMFQEWGFDIIRFCIDMKKSVHDDSYLGAAVNKAREHDAVIILTAFWHDNEDLGGGTNWKPSQLLASTPTEDSRYDVVVQRWGEIADLFKNQMDVWFGVWNEPYWWDGSHGYSEDQWLKDHRALTKIIRDRGASNIVVCQGSHMGQGHEVVVNRGQELVSEFGNIVFDIHMYETRWTLSKEEIKNRIVDVRATVPMMVGEFAIGNHHTRSTNWQDVIDACRETGTSCMYWLYGKEWSERVDYTKAYCREERNTECTPPSGPVAPTISSSPQSQTVGEGGTATFTVQAAGYPLNYQWRRDGQAIEGATQSALSVGPVTLDDDGAVYTVTVSNDEGSVTSEGATLGVTPFEGLGITGGEATIDGGAGEWGGVSSHNLGNVVLGSVSDADDLAATFRVLWSSSHLYILVEVTDDITDNSASTDYENDCVELYIDGTNGKASSYTATDRQYRFIWNSSDIYEKDGHTAGVELGQASTAEGFRMEIAIPWSSVGTTPSVGDYIGLDVHVGDNDGSGREGKLAWAATEDNAWQNPSVFGTAKLLATAVGSRMRPAGAIEAVRVLTTTGRCAIDLGRRRSFTLNVRNSAGQSILRHGATSSVARFSTANLPSGVYIIDLRFDGAVRSLRLPVYR